MQQDRSLDGMFIPSFIHVSSEEIWVQFDRHSKFKAWVKDAFRKAPNREMIKAWIKAVQNVY